MATTGQKYPTLGESVAESPWLDNTWTTPTNIYADDGLTANVTATSFDTPDQTYVLKATGFDFSSIPDSSTINGVICRVNAWYRSGQGSGAIDLMQLLTVAKARVGTNQCSATVALTTNTSTIITKGSSIDLWGNALSPAWVKNSGFGVGLGIIARAANADVDIDYVTLEIDYTPPAGSSILKNIVENIGVSDIDRKARRMARRSAELVGVADSSIKSRGLVRRFVEAVGISDNVQQKIFRLLTKIFVEAVGISDGARRSFGLVRRTIETIDIGEVARKFRNLSRTTVEVVNIADVVVSEIFRLLVKMKTELVGIAENARRAFKFSRIKTEMVSVYDNARLSRTLSRIKTEMVSILESVRASRRMARIVIEALSISDIASKAIFKLVTKVVVESVGILETVSFSIGAVVAAVSEPVIRAFRFGYASSRFKLRNAVRTMTSFLETHKFTRDR